MLKNYYAILEIPFSAQQADIKRAYRKLALEYHPDRNASPNAAAIFREVNEAYEMLGDPQKKALYDQLLAGTKPEAEAVVAASSVHKDPRYRPKPPGFVHTRNSQRKEMLEWMTRNLHAAIRLSQFTLCCSLFLFVDFCLPMKSELQKIVGFETVRGLRGTQGLKIQSSGGTSFSITKSSSVPLSTGDTIVIRSSRVLGVPKRVANLEGTFNSRIRVSIYGNFVFFPAIWLLTSALGVFYKKGIEFRFNLSIVNALLIIFNFIVLMISF